jgi:8-oxo-dGTP pyrophosphatase MutT (NUDIX family)
VKKKRPLPPNTILHSKHAKKVFNGVRFDVYHWKQKLFNGKSATYEIAKRDDTVIIIPIIGDEVFFVKEQQPHWKKPALTLVAGMVESGEDLTSAARRELEEETGMIFENFDLVYIEPAVPAVEWFAFTFIATGFKGQKDKKLDEGEKNKVMKVNLKKLVDMARKRQFFYPPRFIEDYLIRNKEKELLQVLKNPKKFAIKF